MGAGLTIDCDAHVLEPADLWQRYLPQKFKDRAIRIELKDGVEQLLIGEQVVMAGVLAGLGGAETPRRALWGLKYADGCPRASWDPRARAELWDAWHVDKGVLFPTIGILPFPTEDQELANAYCAAYNDWQADFMAVIPDRVVPIAIVNWYDVEAAARELDRNLARGFRGLFVPPETVAGRAPGDPHFDPLWARLCAANAPGCLHVIVRTTGAAIPFRAWHEAKLGAVFTFGLGATGQLMPAMASLVLGGLFERFPTLRVASVEAGCGYAAYLMDRLDEKFRYFDFSTKLRMRPSDYIRRNCYFVAEPEERTIGAMLELVGEDHIVWGSDYPHVDSTVEAPGLLRKQISTLSPERRQRVLGDNAVRLFGL